MNKRKVKFCELKDITKKNSKLRYDTDYIIGYKRVATKKEFDYTQKEISRLIVQARHLGINIFPSVIFRKKGKKQKTRRMRNNE